MWVIDDKSSSLLAKTGDLTYVGEPLITVIASSILDVARGPAFLNIPLTVAECFERNKIAHFLFVYSYCRFSFYQCFANQLLEGTVVFMEMIVN